MLTWYFSPLFFPEILREIKQLYKNLVSQEKQEGPSRRRCLVQIQRALVQSQELGDEKLHLANQIVEMTENRLRNMEMNRDRVETSEKAAQRPAVVPQTVPKVTKKKEEHHGHHEKNNKRPRRQRTQDNGKEKDKKESAAAAAANDNPKPAKKKKRSKTKDRDPSPLDNIPIDPNEPTYCLCNQVSYGEMVGCDHKDCPFEWFHFGCVGLTNKPKGKWYCPRCIQEMKKGKNKWTLL